MASDTKLLGVASGLRPTWANLAVIILFVAAVAGWFIGYGRFSEKVSQLESKMVIMGLRIKEVERWQQDWPTQGELILDRAQNTLIKELLRRVDRLEADSHQDERDDATTAE